MNTYEKRFGPASDAVPNWNGTFGYSRAKTNKFCQFHANRVSFDLNQEMVWHHILTCAGACSLKLKVGAVLSEKLKPPALD